VYWQALVLGIAAAVAAVILGVAVFMPPAPPTPPQLYVKVVPSGGSYLLYVNDSKALREVWYSRNGGPLLKADGPIRAGCGDRVEVVAVYEDGSRHTVATVVKCSAPFKVPEGGVRLGDTARAALKAVEELERALRGKPVTLVTESISCRPGEQLQIRVRVATPGGHYSPPALGCVPIGPDDSYGHAICFDNTGFTLKTWGPPPPPPTQSSYLYIPLTLTYYAPAYAAGSDYLGQNNYTGLLVVEKLGCGPGSVSCYYYVYWFDGVAKQRLGSCGWWSSQEYKLIEQPKDVKTPLEVAKIPAKTDWTIEARDGEVYVGGKPLVYKGPDGKYYVNQELLKSLAGTGEWSFDKVEGNMGKFAGSVFLTIAYDPKTGAVDPKTGVGYEITVTGAGQLYQGGDNAFAYLGTKDGRIGVLAGDWMKFGISPWDTVEIGVIKLLLQMPLDQKICLVADCSAVQYVKNVVDFRVDRVTLRYWGLVGSIHTFALGGMASGMGYGVEVPGLYLVAAYYNATAPQQTAMPMAQTAAQATAQTTTTATTTTLTTTTPQRR